MTITHRHIETTHKSEGSKHDPYSVDIIRISTDKLLCTLRTGALGYIRFTVVDQERGWVLEEKEVLLPFGVDSVQARLEIKQAEEEISKHLEHWIGIDYKTLLRVNDRLERARLAADPFGGHDPYYGGE